MAKGSTIVIIVLLAIIVVGGGIFAGLLISGNLPIGGQQTPASGSGLYIDPNAGEYVAPTQAPQDTKPGVALPGWGSITIPAYATEIGTGVDFFNPATNAGYYYLTFELRLADGEVIYKSGLVEPDKHIQRITLSRGLVPGTYDAAVLIQPYNMDAGITPTPNNGLVNIKLIAK